MKNKTVIKQAASLLVVTILTITAMAQQKVNRKALVKEEFRVRPFSKVQVMEITMELLQKAGLHKHPCPVFGYVAEGTLLFEVKGEEPKTIKKGEAFSEPAGSLIVHFDNKSDTAPLKFIAYYLTNGEKDLVEMFNDK